MVRALFLLAGAAAAGRAGGPRASAEQGTSDPYWYRSETAPWYDSYGRLHRGYREAPMKNPAPGREPYYFYGERSPWYDSQGRSREGPQATDKKEYPAGAEPYYHYGDSVPWYDSYGRLRYGPRGLAEPGRGR